MSDGERPYWYLPLGGPHNNDAENIIVEVCQAYGIKKNELFSKSSKRRYVIPRHIVMARLYYESGMTETDIGDLFGRDRTTAIYAIHQSSWSRHIEEAHKPKA